MDVCGLWAIRIFGVIPIRGITSGKTDAVGVVCSDEMAGILFRAHSVTEIMVKVCKDKITKRRVLIPEKTLTRFNSCRIRRDLTVTRAGVVIFMRDYEEAGVREVSKTALGTSEPMRDSEDSIGIVSERGLMAGLPDGGDFDF